MWTSSHIIQLWYKYIHWTEGRTKGTGTGGTGSWDGGTEDDRWTGYMDIAALGQIGHTDITGLVWTGVLVVSDEYDQERKALSVGREEGILLVGTGGGPVWGIMTGTVTEWPGERDQRGSRQPDKFGRSGHLEGTSDSQVRTALWGHWMVPLLRREGDGPLSSTQSILIMPRQPGGVPPWRRWAYWNWQFIIKKH